MDKTRTTYNILIADDHQLVMDGIKSLMTKSKKFKIVREALNGQQAIDILNTSNIPIHILLLDVTMPLLSGIEVCKIVKRQHPNIKVLLVSMYHSTSVIKEALSAEADGYILKNTGQEELIAALEIITEDGTYFSQDITPILTQLVKKQLYPEKKLKTLTAREKEVIMLIVNEHTSEDIAAKLFISKKTVEKHRANILEKTECKSTIGLVKYALENGLDKK